MAVTLLSIVSCSERAQPQLAQGQLAPLQPGQVLVLNYWAKWCKPCKEEIPELNQLKSEAAGIFVVGVDFDDHRAEALDQLVVQMGIQFPVLANLQQATLLHSKLATPPKVLPTSYVLYYDQAGTQPKIQTFIGPQTATGLLAQIKAFQAH